MLDDIYYALWACIHFSSVASIAKYRVAPASKNTYQAIVLSFMRDDSAAKLIDITINTLNAIILIIRINEN